MWLNFPLLKCFSFTHNFLDWYEILTTKNRLIRRDWGKWKTASSRTLGMQELCHSSSYSRNLMWLTLCHVINLLFFLKFFFVGPFLFIARTKKNYLFFNFFCYLFFWQQPTVLSLHWKQLREQPWNNPPCPPISPNKYVQLFQQKLLKTDPEWRSYKPPKFIVMQKCIDFELWFWTLNAPKHSKQLGLTWKFYHNN